MRDSVSGRPEPENPLVLHVLGARPNFVKAAPVVRALAELGVRQGIVHTGQHYDALMSDVFFADLGLPEPVANLGVGSGTHARRPPRCCRPGGCRSGARPDPGRRLRRRELDAGRDPGLRQARHPDRARRGGPALLRPGMPEEVNRVVTDALSDMLFATSPDALSHLAAEGVPAAKVHLVGNPMIDSLFSALDRARPGARCGPARTTGALRRGDPAPPGNVDTPAAAKELVDAVLDVSDRQSRSWCRSTRGAVPGWPRRAW